MMHRTRVSVLILALVMMFSLVGCGFDRLAAPLPDLVPGLTLEQLEDIQQDERLTDDERREQIREATGVADDDDGNRLVEFLLTLTVP